MAIHHLDWFYPAFMVVLGAHYLPFVFLYGMRLFAVLSFALVSLGVLLAHHPELAFAAPAWLTGLVLILFAFVGFVAVNRNRI